MNKLYLIIGLFVFAYAPSLVAQDGIAWGHHITFEFTNMDFSLRDTNDTLLSVDFFANKRFISTACQASELKGAISGQYILALSCSAIGGESQVSTIKCADIFMKMEFKQSLKNGHDNYITRFIPFIFDSSQGPFQKIVVPQIDINYLLTHGSPVVMIDAQGNYKILDFESIEDKPIMYNLVRFNKVDF